MSELKIGEYYFLDIVQKVPNRPFKLLNINNNVYDFYKSREGKEGWEERREYTLDQLNRIKITQYV